MYSHLSVSKKYSKGYVMKRFIQYLLISHLSVLVASASSNELGDCNPSHGVPTSSSSSTIDPKSLVLIHEPLSDEKGKFLRYVSKPSEFLLQAFKKTKGKISLANKEDIPKFAGYNNISKDDDNYIFVFTSGDPKIDEGWKQPSHPVDMTRTLGIILGNLQKVLEHITQEKIDESTKKAQSVLEKAYASRASGKSNDFEITESSILNEGNVEVNLTDVISGGEKRFIFAENETAIEDLLRHTPAVSTKNYFILGYPGIRGFYSDSIEAVPSLEITASKNFVCAAGKFVSSGALTLKTEGSMVLAEVNIVSPLRILSADFLSFNIPKFLRGSWLGGDPLVEDQVLLIDESVIKSFFGKNPIPTIYLEFLCKRLRERGIIAIKTKSED